MRPFKKQNERKQDASKNNYKISTTENENHKITTKTTNT